MNICKDLILPVLITFLGVLLALYFDKQRLPKFFMTASEDANLDRTYSLGHPKVGQRWKYFRIRIFNKKMTWWLSWLVKRQTAENCRATINFVGINNDTDFTFKGRWASTPELPFLNEKFVKIFQPDPVTIAESDSEILDVITKCENDHEAYGWNNEAYLDVHDWRTPEYKLNEGKYKVRIVINTQNGVSLKKEFYLTVDSTIKNTRLENYQIT